MTGIAANQDQEVAGAWARVEAALARVLPASLPQLAAPSSAQDIAAVEAALGLTLPPDFRASLGIHNGTGWERPCPMPMECLYDTDGIVEWTQDWRRNGTGEEDDWDDGFWTVNGPVRPVVGVPGHVVVATMNGDVTWFLDLVPEPGGTPGQVVRVDIECTTWDVLAPSWTQLLIRYAEDLERYAAAPESSSLDINPDVGPACEWGARSISR